LLNNLRAQSLPQVNRDPPGLAAGANLLLDDPI